MLLMQLRVGAEVTLSEYVMCNICDVKDLILRKVFEWSVLNELMDSVSKISVLS